MAKLHVKGDMAPSMDPVDMGMPLSHPSHGKAAMREMANAKPDAKAMMAAHVKAKYSPMRGK